MKKIKIPCRCVSGPEYCDYLVISDYKDKECEFKILKQAIYCKEKDIRKIIKFLNSII